MVRSERGHSGAPLMQYTPYGKTTCHTGRSPRALKKSAIARATPWDGCRKSSMASTPPDSSRSQTASRDVRTDS